MRFAEQKAERTKTSLEKRIERLQKQNIAAMPVIERTRAEKLTPPPAQARPERRAANPLIEKAPETNERQIAAPPEQQADSPENVELPPDRRVETSAWHRIEVDKRTGKAVENPTLAYGEEFQREQHQEQLRKEIASASVDSETTRQQYTPFREVQQSYDPAHALPAHTATHSDDATDSPVDKAKDIAKDVLSRSEPVDIGLWVVLVIIIMAIIAAL